MKFKKFIGVWNPEKDGKEITGKIRTLKDEVKIKGYIYKQYVLETEESIVSVLGATVLDRMMIDMGVQVGETIKIKYLGMKKGESSEYKDFEVYVGIKE